MYLYVICLCVLLLNCLWFVKTQGAAGVKKIIITWGISVTGKFCLPCVKRNTKLNKIRLKFKTKYPEMFNDFQSHKTMIMYHGTSRSSAREIIKEGFRASTGGCLGPGVYATRDISKARGYVKKRGNVEGVILKVEVETGLVKKIYSSGHSLKYNWAIYGYDSSWIPKGAGAGAGDLEEFCINAPKKVKVIGTLDKNGNEIDEC